MKCDSNTYKIGIDAGSTTLKIVLLDPSGKIIHKTYRRHQANINDVLTSDLNRLAGLFPGKSFVIHLTGSAGMGIAERTGVPFIQEVVASVKVVEEYYPDVHTLIDLGGEDAKMVFFRKGKQPDIRMNGSCAGGTGAFIDQMADLMNISVEELGQSALQYSKIYPVASRCGVFAKTDIQNLIGRNVAVPDLSRSILHAVALQSITTLSRGCEVIPKVLCIGGPLTFLSALREEFREMLHISEHDIILPENSEYFPAWGAALHPSEDKSESIDIHDFIKKLDGVESRHEDALPPLFSGQEDYSDWLSNRKIKTIAVRAWENEKEIRCFLGIDSGSTTTKVVAIDEDARLLYNYYDANEGNPLKKAVEGLSLFLEKAKKQNTNIRFLGATATGYGEELIRTALGLDHGIVETMAHLSGAQYVNPDVSFILDIGGQDIKSLFVRNGIISNIELNESCSSGCGSFLQNFASTMEMSLADFSASACLAQYPCDLGSRCTVFMNSKVKQSLRENATLGDIASGLAYSVVKNCLFKVLKINNLNLLGDHIVVQGGTFRNHAVYRALELLSGKTVSSTDHPELMGAFGAALYARQKWLISPADSAFTGKQALPDASSVQIREINCQGCSNHCNVSRFSFPNGNTCHAGNKCEKVFFSQYAAKVKGYNGFEFKSHLLFGQDELSGTNPGGLNIGIPRALNFYENYPFWHALFSNCGFRITLSPESTTGLYQKGVGSVMADNICFPAKLVHGHILSLIEQKVDRIFYPIVPKEEKEFKDAANSFNCPVVSGYPDVIRSAIDPEGCFGIPFDTPVITFNNTKALKKSCHHYFSGLGVTDTVFEKAFKQALNAKKTFVNTLRKEQLIRLQEVIAHKGMAFVIAGRPYHTDVLVHQKVGQILSDSGIHVFTDDVFRQEECSGFRQLNMVSQWAYPNRVVQAAMEIARMPQHVQLVQLNSFGCGPDSFLMDEIGDILKKAGKNHTILRIDEIASPGSIRLRLRSLVESLQQSQAFLQAPETHKGYSGHYTKNDRKKTILLPWFADFLSPFFPAIGELAGYKLVNLPRSCKETAEVGLKYGHNEVCYPSTLVLGDIIHALQSGKYDTEQIVVAITQTGGQCRATNYIAQIKSGLANAGFPTIPVIALTTGKVFQNEQSAFKPPILKLINIGIYTLLYGDILQQMFNAISVREKQQGETQHLFDFYVERGIEAIRKNDHRLLLKFLSQAVADFNQVVLNNHPVTKIGLIGEIYLKYNNYGQAHIAEWLRSQEIEVVTPPILDFIMQYFVNSKENIKTGVRKYNALLPFAQPIAWKFMNDRIREVESIFASFRFYQPSKSIFAKAEEASRILSLSNQFGEGWAIAAEVSHYAEQGINRVVCVQPFGCIANHVVAKGIEKRLKKFYPDMNLLYLDIDSGVAEVNLQNRLHFIMH